MLKPNANVEGYEITTQKYKSPGGILINSRTVVEKNDFVSTGMLTYAEGDILEIEMTEYKAFKLGDSVKLTVYSPGGIYGFQSTVVAKDHGALMIINPPHNQKRFAEKREHPRVDVDETGMLLSLGLTDQEEFPNHIEMTVQNISISGIGFVITEEIDVTPNMLLTAVVDLGFIMPIRAEVMRLNKADNRIYIGAKFIDLAADKANSLRAYVLKKQVELHFANKRNETVKRVFK